MNEIKEWFLGKQEKNVYRKGILGILALFLGSIFLSILFYPRNFSFLSTQVSSLGGFRPESPGYYLFTFGLIFTGILLIPHGLFLYQCLKDDLGILGYISVVLLFFASIGISLVGIFPTDLSYAAHLIAAIMAFGGIGLGMLFMLFPLIKMARNRMDWPSYKLIIILSLPLLITMVITGIIVGIPVGMQLLNGLEIDEPEIWALCEWFLVFTSVFWFFGLILTCDSELNNKD